MILMVPSQFLAKTKPGNPVGEEGLLVVATPAHQLLSMASPMLDPMISTPEGVELLKTVLNEPSPRGKEGKEESPPV